MGATVDADAVADAAVIASTTTFTDLICIRGINEFIWYMNFLNTSVR